MTWIKLDDNVADHPKISGLSDRAFRWWIKGLCYASRFLTDGLLPPAFFSNVPKQVRSELTFARLWVVADPDLRIHDYLSHQTSREAVENERRRNRDRRGTTAGRTSGRTAGTTSGTTDGNTSGGTTKNPRPDTENRTQIQKQTTTTSSRGPSIVKSPAEIYRLQQTHSFVGSKLHVPHSLHRELLTKSGSNAEVELQSWYLELDERLEDSGQGTGDVFAWLRPRHQVFAVSKGWIEAAPKASEPVRKPFSVQDALDREAARKAGKAS